MGLLVLACDPSSTAPEAKAWDCAVPANAAIDFTPTLGCREDFRTLSAHPFDQSLPGAFTVKTLIDRADGNRLYFLDTRKYNQHYIFASEHLSGNGKPMVRPVSEFGLTEYYTPERRFILGTLAYYEGPGIWDWELMPGDNADAELIALAFLKIAEACYCGKDLSFHATSLAIEAEARKLPSAIKVITTAKVYEAIDYQPLNLASGFGRLVFTTAAALKLQPAGAREILVMDSVPNEIPMGVGGLITREFQTPLSHVNVLAQDRGTPNMGLRGALSDSALRALEGKWVNLKVGPFDYSITEATEAEADAWRDAHPPDKVPVPGLDTTQRELRDAAGILDLSLGRDVALKRAIPAYGGKAGHFAAFAYMDSAKVKYHPAFGIPVYYYRQHLSRHGLWDTVESMLADPKFRADQAERDKRLKSLRASIEAAPIDSAFRKSLGEKLDAKFPGKASIRFQASSNASDLDSLTGAGLYGSRIGERNSEAAPLDDALREVWAGVWDLRAFEERSLSGIDHRLVGMAVLVQEDRRGELANGVALTASPFDPVGAEPGFYINAQVGEASVTRPAPSATSDQFIYHFGLTGQPIVRLAHSTLAPLGDPVLTKAQTYALGTALQEILIFFWSTYGIDHPIWYALEVEFELSRMEGGSPASEPVIIMKQVRPYQGWR